MVPRTDIVERGRTQLEGGFEFAVATKMLENAAFSRLLVASAEPNRSNPE